MTEEAQASNPTKFFKKGKRCTIEVASWGRMRNHVASRAIPGKTCPSRAGVTRGQSGAGAKLNGSRARGRGRGLASRRRARSGSAPAGSGRAAARAAQFRLLPSRLLSPRVAGIFSALRDGAGPRRYWGRRGCEGLGQVL